ncbi:hypothetical protein GCM10023085_12990 [Actinomadura viridis]
MVEPAALEADGAELVGCAIIRTGHALHPNAPPRAAVPAADLPGTGRESGRTPAAIGFILTFGGN